MPIAFKTASKKDLYICIYVLIGLGVSECGRKNYFCEETLDGRVREEIRT